jgi:hypothetical protein
MGPIDPTAGRHTAARGPVSKGSANAPAPAYHFKPLPGEAGEPEDRVQRPLVCALVARRLKWLLLAALVAAVATGVVAFVALHSSSGQGPLAAKTGGRNGRIGVAQPAAIGRAISISGPLIVQNTGDHALVLDRVDRVGLQSGIYRGAYVLPWPPNQTPFTGALTYRVPRDGRTMPGATVAPHAYLGS